MGSRIGYFISEAFRYFWSNKFMSFASVGVMMACIFILGGCYVVYENVNVNVELIESRNEVVAFIEDELLPDGGLEEVRRNIDAIENIRDITFVSREDALEDYMNRYPDYRDLFEDIESDNFMRDSFVLTLHDLDLYDETVYGLEQVEGVDYIRTRKDVVDKLNEIGGIAGVISMVVVGTLLLASIFIVVNTIKLARFFYRRQINIMKYVGATDWFIRWPFVFEGAIIGLLSGLIAFFLEWYVYSFVIERIDVSTFELVIIPFSDLSLTLLGSFVGFGVLVGVLASSVSIRQYLEV